MSGHVPIPRRAKITVSWSSANGWKLRPRRTVHVARVGRRSMARSMLKRMMMICRPKRRYHPSHHLSRPTLDRLLPRKCTEKDSPMPKNRTRRYETITRQRRWFSLIRRLLLSMIPPCRLAWARLRALQRKQLLRRLPRSTMRIEVEASIWRMMCAIVPGWLPRLPWGQLPSVEQQPPPWQPLKARVNLLPHFHLLRNIRKRAGKIFSG
mmetsp:Transcript_7926/g.22071  ORF Transcript_7926/g.22071 Transcript_7926/m.22071 type:complete len:209 (-) Transcript_7926:1279-1905(-)